MIEKKYKKLLNLFIICLLGLILISSVYGADELQYSNDDIVMGTTIYDVSSDLSNDDIQSMLDNAGQGDTFNFVSKEYKGISLVVDKKVNIISNVNSTVYTSGELSNKAQELNIDKTFGFYFTKNSAGSVLSGFNIVAASSDYGVIVDNSDNTIIRENSIVDAGNNVLVKNSKNVTLFGNVLNNAKENGLQLKNVSSCYVANNTMMFNDLVLEGQLWTYLADLNEQALERLSLIVEQMKISEGVTEELKAADQMVWVRAMNSIHNRAEEIVLKEIVYR